MVRDNDSVRSVFSLVIGENKVIKSVSAEKGHEKAQLLVNATVAKSVNLIYYYFGVSNSEYNSLFINILTSFHTC